MDKMNKGKQQYAMRFNTRLTENNFRRIKEKAYFEDKTITNVVNEIFEDYFDNHSIQK